MVSHLTRLGRLGGLLLLCIGGGLGFGCAHPPAARPADDILSPGKELSAFQGVPSSTSGEYILQIGDEIDIQVYREPELSGTFRINSSGEIRHSLAGAIPMAGKTVKEAEAYFTQRLDKDYLVNPRVIIKMVSTQSSQIVVLGEVEKPGVYPLPVGEPMTLLHAIAGAGGFTELASPDRVRIVRKAADGHQTTLRVRVSDLLGGKGKQQDIPLEPNDVIMVPEVVF
jgi:protein involved in polysaccharide export with SLBB domain